MSSEYTAALLLDPSVVLEAQGMTPDPWQRELLLCTSLRLLLNCCRGAGKSRTCSALALHTALFRPDSLVLLLSRALRQATELLRYVKQGWKATGRLVPLRRMNDTQIELLNGSRIVSLPGREETIRSFQGVTLLILDEAARVPVDLYWSVRPMLNVSRGRLVCLSTPFGARGFFWKEWHDERADWKRVRITWHDCPRITEAAIADERRAMGDSWVAQEYECSFATLEGRVYPDFARAIVEQPEAPQGRAVGGIDFGWRNPFAAIWGVLDGDDVLWLTGERYARQTPLHEHAAALRKLPGVVWYADPSGRTETEELRAAGLKVLPGWNDIRLGIAAVTARLQTGRLKVLRGACPNLLAEAGLYRYPTASERRLEGELPVDDHNHALGALRYLVSRLDAHHIARLRKERIAERAAPKPAIIEPSEEMWTRLT